MEGGYREIDNVSREQSLGKEDKIFMGDALVLKRSSCSLGNFAAKFLSVIFKPSELINRNCTGTRRKGRLNAAKMGIVKVCIKTLSMYPSARGHKVEEMCYSHRQIFAKEKAEWAGMTR